MIPSLSSVLAFAGLAAAALEPRQIMHEARDVPSFVHHRDIRDSGSTPCAQLSEVYNAADKTDGKAVILAVPPSVGIACLKSVPYDKERDLELLDYLLRYVEFQSTTEILANPPDEYLLPGVDIYGGFQAIKTKLENGEYESQYDVMKDLQSIYAGAMDNHFNYSPAILHTFLFVRRGLNFVSISADGVRLPQIYNSDDVGRGNRKELDYHPSAVDSIDDVPIFEWLEQDAIYNIANYQDPDAQFNALFRSVASYAANKDATALITSFEIPDNYTIKFANGSSLVVQNEILFLPGADFSNIKNGEDFHEAFELPPTTETTEPTETPIVEPSVAPTPTEKPQPEPTATNVPGYPKPIVKHSQNSIAGYFLEGDDYKDVAVLTILGFLPVGFDFESSGDFNLTEFVLEGTAVIVEFVEQAKKAGRDKLIVDVSANGGGSVVLAEQIYSLLFPQPTWNVYNRFRANLALEAAGEADYASLVQLFITADDSWPLGTDGKPIKNAREWFGPETADGQNVTSAFRGDNSLPWDENGILYLNGVEEDTTFIPEAPFKPENMLVITDGTCASACGILTGYLTRNHGVRTVAYGGRALHSPMQAMGGVKGTRLNFNNDILRTFVNIIKINKDDTDALSILESAADSLPKFVQPPLLPLLGPGSGGQVNSLNGYTDDDLEGIPVHFRYEAANCKLFYTQRMTVDIAETWRLASQVGWHGASCVVGSTVNSDGTIGDEALAYDASVRSRSYQVEGPGVLA